MIRRWQTAREDGHCWGDGCVTYRKQGTLQPSYRTACLGAVAVGKLRRNEPGSHSGPFVWLQCRLSLPHLKAKATVLGHLDSLCDQHGGDTRHKLPKVLASSKPRAGTAFYCSILVCAEMSITAEKAKSKHTKRVQTAPVSLGSFWFWVRDRSTQRDSYVRGVYYPTE